MPAYSQERTMFFRLIVIDLGIKKSVKDARRKVQHFQIIYRNDFYGEARTYLELPAGSTVAQAVKQSAERKEFIV